MRGWFSKARTVLRRSQASPPQGGPSSAVGPGVSVGRAGSDAQAAGGKGGTEAAERLLKAALAEHGATVIDYDALRVFNATERAESHASGSRSDELWATFLLVDEHQRRGDLKTATDYAMAMVRLMEQDGADDDAEESPSRAAVQEMVTDLAEDQCHAENYEDARVLAAAAVGLVPDAPKSHYVLCWALRGLERFEEALSSLDHALALAPSIADLHAYRADLLRELGRYEEAVHAADQALVLEPGDVRFYFLRGGLRQMLGQHEAAIADFDRVISGVEQSPSVAVRQDGITLADRAEISRLKSPRQLGRIDEVAGNVGRLVSGSGPWVAVLARMLLGELYESLGRQGDAMAVYADVLAAGYQDAPARVRRAQLFLGQGMPDEAVADLAPLVVSQQEAADAIPVLLDLLQHTPEHAGARKALGQAYLSTWRKAHAALTAAMAARPDDWELRYARAMAAITHVQGDDFDRDHGYVYETDEQEAAWNNSFSDERVIQAIEDLVAASVRTTDPAVEEALHWLADRAGVLVPHQLIAMTRSADGRYGQALPELTVLAKMEDAAEAGSRRRWREAVDQLTTVRAELAEAGLPILTAQADLHLADCYLRLYEIQNSLDHLDAAEEGISFLGMPLDEGARGQFLEIRDRELERGNQPRIVDLDHRELFEAVGATMRIDLTIIRMEAVARIGGRPHGNSGGLTLGSLPQEILEYLSQGQVSSRQALAVGRLLRDAGRFDEALQIAEYLESSSDADDLGAAHNLASTVFLRTGDLESAAEHSLAVLNIAQRPEDITAAANNLAASYLQRGDPEEALRLLDAHPPSPQLPAQIRFASIAQRGQALLQLGDFAGAQREFTAALVAQDKIRGDLRSLDDRMQWHARQVPLYEPAVRAAYLNQDSVAAFELVEQSKARAFVDQLAAGPVPVSPEEGDLDQVLGRVAARQAVLRRLAAAGDYVDLELVQRFTALGGRDLVERGEDGSVRLPAERLGSETISTDAAAARLKDRVEETRRKSVQSIVGQVLSAAELRALLIGAPGGGSR